MFFTSTRRLAQEHERNVRAAETRADERSRALAARVDQLASENEDLRKTIDDLRGAFEVVRRSTELIHENGHPRTDRMAQLLRAIPILQWNMKLVGEYIGVQIMAGAGRSDPPGESPLHHGLTSKLCTQQDHESDWFRYWHDGAFSYYRKSWEYAFVLQALWEAGLLQSGRRGLGFAVGREVVPAVLAARGVGVLATDLPAEDERASGWKETGQHADALSGLHMPHIVGADQFYSLCDYRPVDMNAIPADLHGTFDFCWSMCSFEHCGSLDLGMDFVVNSVKCLKPGGVAVHTCEFNLHGTDETIDNWGTVIFQRKHIEEIARRLTADGHELMTPDYSPGTGLLDSFVDTTPFPHQPHFDMRLPNSPHLRLDVDGFPATSFGLIVKAGA